MVPLKKVREEEFMDGEVRRNEDRRDDPKGDGVSDRRSISIAGRRRVW